MGFSSNLSIVIIFILALVIRFFSIYPANTIIGFDQARDLFDSTTIFKDLNLRIIGPTAGNNSNLHHGVLYIYYILPPLFLFGGNPIWVALWNSIFNGATAVILYFLSKALFKSSLAAITSAIIAAFSYQFVQYSGWLSNPTATIFTVPVFFLGLWQFHSGQKWGLPLSSFFLGLSIQFELFFIYLIPVATILWILLKMKLPDVRVFVLSIISLLLATSTMVLTEIKFGFGSITALLKAGNLVAGPKENFILILEKFFQRFWEIFSLNLWPQEKKLGMIIGLAVTSYLIFQLINSKLNKKITDRNLFLLIYLFSPTIMLLLGYHGAPWFLIGVPPAVALVSGYVISQLRPKLLILLTIILIIWSNVSLTIQSTGKGQALLEPDQSALLSDQLRVIDYTYQGSQENFFTINSLTNPLYINAVWAYHYNWYGQKKYGYQPTWSGGDQLYPYNTLPKTSGNEKFLYLLIDNTPRIPVSHKLSLLNWADQKSKLIEEKTFGGILVQKRELN